MRATRAAMIGGPGVAKLGLANDDVRSKSVIVADHISKSFAGRPIIRDFTFRTQRGDRIGIVGANGAGKSTLLGLLTGEVAPDAGKVTIDRKSVVSGQRGYVRVVLVGRRILQKKNH